MSTSSLPSSARLMSAPTSNPAVVIVGPKSEFSIGISTNAAPVAVVSCSSSSGISDTIAIPVTTPIRMPSSLERSDNPSATLARSEVMEPIPFYDLGELPVMLGRRKIASGQQIQLVRSEHPHIVTLAHSALAPALDVPRSSRDFSRLQRLSGVEVRELRDPNRHDGRRYNGIAKIPQVSKGFLEDGSVIEARHNDRWQ